MKLASIEIITAVERHQNADALSICSVLGFKCITQLDQYKAGDVICFIQPDCVLPDKLWAEFYKKKSGRTKAIRLRQVWSEGIIESLETVGYTGPLEVGREISADIGVTHYEPPLPQELNAKGGLPFYIPATDEERLENLEVVPWGEIVDVTLKVDGQSFSAFCDIADTPSDGHVSYTTQFGVTGRRMEYKLDCENNFTRNSKAFNLEDKLTKFCIIANQSICIRGEQYGAGIQKSPINPHAKLPLSLAFYGVWLINERRYARKGEEFYAYNLIPALNLPTCPVVERDVILTPELVKKYAEDLTEINGHSFEGVVVQWRGGSFKILNKTYDSKK